MRTKVAGKPLPTLIWDYGLGFILRASEAVHNCLWCLPSLKANLSAGVRSQLDRIDDLLMTEKDPQRWIALPPLKSDCRSKEFALAGRPMPGSLKPRSREPRFKLPPLEPIEDELPESPSHVWGPRLSRGSRCSRMLRNSIWLGVAVRNTNTPLVRN